jgi:hypothetical protein
VPGSLRRICLTKFDLAKLVNEGLVIALFQVYYMDKHDPFIASIFYRKCHLFKESYYYGFISNTHTRLIR